MICSGNEAEKRYLIRLNVAMTVYVLSIVGLHYVFHGPHPPQGWVLYGLAMVPAVPILAVLAIFGLYITEERDELKRAVMVQSSLWATGLTLGFTTFRGFLENYAGVHPMPLYACFMVWCVALGIVKPIIWWRYR